LISSFWLFSVRPCCARGKGLQGSRAVDAPDTEGPNLALNVGSLRRRNPSEVGGRPDWALQQVGSYVGYTGYQRLADQSVPSCRGAGVRRGVQLRLAQGRASMAPISRVTGARSRFWPDFYRPQPIATSFSMAPGRPPLNRGIGDEVNLHVLPEFILVRRQPERLAPFDGGQRSFGDGLGWVGMRTDHHGLAGERSILL
jgi:hypothetical protein